MKQERTFQDVANAIESVTPPPQYESYYSGTYLLLVGAAYSIGCADKLAKGIARQSERDRWPALKGVLQTSQPLEIETYWGETHFLTNALFRIAHSTDRIGKPKSEIRVVHEHKTGFLADCMISYSKHPVTCCFEENNRMKHEIRIPEPENAMWYWNLATLGLIRQCELLNEKRKSKRWKNA